MATAQGLHRIIQDAHTMQVHRFEGRDGILSGTGRLPRAFAATCLFEYAAPILGRFPAVSDITAGLLYNQLISNEDVSTACIILDGLRALPVNVMACKLVLVIWGAAYPNRLWCIWEFFTLLALTRLERAVKRIQIDTLITHFLGVQPC